MTQRRLKINSTRNSECDSAPLKSLHWSRWDTDGALASEFGYRIYLHVAGANGTTHRVYCKHADRRGVRIALQDGVLYWLVDQ